MSCPIEILEVKGINPSSTRIVNSVEISGRLTNGSTGCEIVYVKLLAPPTSVEEINVDDDGTFNITIDTIRIRCGDTVKVWARCKDCDPVEGEFEIRCPLGTRPLYVSYYDCDGWNSNVEVMNIQNYRATFIITIYSRGGSQVYQANISANAHATKRLQFDTIDRRRPIPTQGLVIVAPENDGDEFPSMLCITNESIPSSLPIKTTQLQRFVPFIRIPHERRVI